MRLEAARIFIIMATCRNMLDQFRAIRRKTVKKSGRFLLGVLARIIRRQSLIGVQPVLDKSVFPWVAGLEANWKEMQSEVNRLLADRDNLPTFHQVSPDQKRISTGDSWKTCVLFVFGDRFEPNCRRYPATARQLAQVPNLRNAGFSILAPHYRIPPHKGPTNGLVRIHLALKIPRDNENCWLRVDDRVLHWKEGEIIAFDDLYEHEVQNNTDEERVVLFFDVERPLRLPGRLINRSLLAIMKHTAYVTDAARNLRQWESRYPSQQKQHQVGPR